MESSYLQIANPNLSFKGKLFNKKGKQIRNMMQVNGHVH